MKGYVTSLDSPIIVRLMEILVFFDYWHSSLQASPPPTSGGDQDWKRHFITRESWFDLRACILGFVSVCRYLLEFPARFQEGNLSDAFRYINPRTFSQANYD
ncbi:unnamed protein product [Ectocarpus sp. 12 AP-2014]